MAKILDEMDDQSKVGKDALIYQKRDRMAYGVLLGYLAVMILVGRFAPF